MCTICCGIWSTTSGRARRGEEVACHNDLSPKNTVYRDDGDGLRPYGVARRDRAELVETILWWQDRCWRGLEGEAERGEVEAVQDAYAWVAEHRAELHAAVT